MAQRTPINVSFYRPLVVVDAADGYWFAIITDGAKRIEVTDWPVTDCEFSVNASTVLRVELYLANDTAQFLRGEGRPFADLCIPISQVSKQGWFFRSWLGLQRGCHLEEADGDISAEMALERYETAVMLAKNLLTPKICCTIVPSDLTNSNCALPDDRQGLAQMSSMLNQTVVHQCNIIHNLHRQLCTLWTKGKIICAMHSNGDLAARLSDVPSELQDGQADEADLRQSLQDDVTRLTEGMMILTSRLEESNHLKLTYRDRLMELSGECFEEDDSMVADEIPESLNFNLQALQRENRQLSQALEAERACSRSLQRDMEASSSSWMQQSDRDEPLAAGNGAVDQMRRRHTEESNRLQCSHAAEVEALRHAERQQREVAQELQRKNDNLGREAMKRETQVMVLQEELREGASRAAEAWSSKKQTVLWDGRDPPANALHLAELEAARREADQLRQKLLASEEFSDGSGGKATASRPRNVITERARGLLQDLRQEPLARMSERDRAMSREIENLVSLTERLQRERDGSRAASDEHCRRCEVAEKRVEHLQREVDRAAGEAMLSSSSADQVSQLTVLQELRSLRPPEPASASSSRAGSSQVTTLLGTELFAAREAEAVAEVKLQRLEATYESREQQTQEAGNAELHTLRERLRARNTEHAQAMLNLKEEANVGRQEFKEQAEMHSDALLRRDAQHSRRSNQLYDELRQEKEACTEARAARDRSGIGSHKAELDQFREVEATLRSELQDLEDVNRHMLAQNQQQMEDFNTMQERLNREVLSFKKEKRTQDSGSTSLTTDLAQMHQANKSLQQELQALRSQCSGDGRRPDRVEYSLSLETERRVAQHKAQLAAASANILGAAFRKADAPAQASFVTSGSCASSSEISISAVEGVWGVEGHQACDSSVISERSAVSMSSSHAHLGSPGVKLPFGSANSGLYRVAAPVPTSGGQANGILSNSSLEQLRSHGREVSRQQLVQSTWLSSLDESPIDPAKPSVRVA